jgi:peptidoglycan/LPS O-acetylase OafA/YrhL
MLSWEPFVFLGHASFSMYMLHQLLMKVFAWRLPAALSTPYVFFPVLLVIATASYLIIEEPARRFLTKKRARPESRLLFDRDPVITRRSVE